MLDLGELLYRLCCCELRMMYQQDRLGSSPHACHAELIQQPLSQ